MYEIRPTKSYRKAYKRLSKTKNFDSLLINRVINILAEGGKLAPKYHDHQLTGSLKNFRECHVMSDLLLVYQKYDKALILVLVDIGSHSDVF